MDAAERGSLYLAAMRDLSPYLERRQDGTFSLEIRSGEQVGIDPVIFADLARSLEETNKKITDGEIDPNDVRMGF